MTATVTRIVDSGESQQTWRYRWYEGLHAFYVWDSQADGKRRMRGFGDGVDMFCESPEEGSDCLVPGTQQFYHALNAYFTNEQAEIEEMYFKGD